MNDLSPDQSVDVAPIDVARANELEYEAIWRLRSNHALRSVAALLVAQPGLLRLFGWAVIYKLVISPLAVFQ
jgi:hypothetical protein